MKANEILQAAQMYNTILAAMKECKKVNEANNYEGDNLFVVCDKAGYLANELGDIMPNRFNNNSTYFFKSIAETAAKFAELCLAAGCTPTDIYTSY